MKPIKLTRAEFLKLAGVGSAAAISVVACRSNVLNEDLSESGGPDHHLAWRPDPAVRFTGPLRRLRRGSSIVLPLTWEAAIAQVGKIFCRYAPHEIAFLLGVYPDHLNHLVRIVARSLGGASVLRFGGESGFEARVTLMDACRKLFGTAGIPIFDLSKASVIFSFGASFQESWLSPDAGFAQARPGAYLVQFEARCSRMAELADEWIPIIPGSEALLARTLAGLAGGADRQANSLEARRSLRAAALHTGVSAQELVRLARLFKSARGRLALPGGAALATPGGLQAAEWILALNLLQGGALGASGIFIAPPVPLCPELSSRPASAAEIGALAENISLGRIKALFIHGADPLNALPRAYGWEQALRRAERIILFSSAPDASAMLADLILPDHARGESWGYQVRLDQADLGCVEAIYPRSAPRFNTRSTAEVLLAALKLSGIQAGGLDFRDEQDFLARSLARLNSMGGEFHSGRGEDFFELWKMHGGWRRAQPARLPPVAVSAPTLEMHKEAPGDAGFSIGGAFHLIVHAGTGRSWQSGELPLAVVHPRRAGQLGLSPGDLAIIHSASGSLRVRISLNPDQHPDVLALAWYADTPVFQESSGGLTRPLDLLGLAQNSSGDLVTSGLPIRLERLV